MKEVIIKNEEDAKKFIINSTDTSIAMHLACLEKTGISRDKVVGIVHNTFDHIHKLIVDSGLIDDELNVGTCICMIIFSSSLKAYLFCVDELAEKCGVDRETFLNEMLLEEMSLLRDNMR